MTTDARQEFESLVGEVTRWLRGRDVAPALRDELDRAFPPQGGLFRRMASLCRRGLDEGWLGPREAGGIRYGRAVKPGPETAGFSVDVVEMTDVKGPHHRHPNGEIDMIMPVTPGARFDGNGEGWLVYGADSAHHPTVTEGRAVVLYLLPDGAIEFTRT